MKFFYSARREDYRQRIERVNSRKKGRVYIHGYNAQEQKRLGHQSDFLEQTIHEGLDLSTVQHLLEIGCGTGAQTKILLRNFPKLHMTAIDISESQIGVAKERFKEFPDLAGRVTFSVADAAVTNFPDRAFDGAFICWVLEHAQKPIDIIRETHRCLKPGSPLVVSEVYNSAFYLKPSSPSIEHYWSKFNQLQTNMGGDPCIGMKLGNLLVDGGCNNIGMRVLCQHHDKRNDANRQVMLNYFQQLLLSAKANLLQEDMIREQEAQDMVAELEALKMNTDTIIYLMGMQAIGYA